ncbi:MAG: YlbF family regulator [Clostridia bacterium]|nr:YlbF family regulator [Clostridia bacterium]
MKEIIEKAKELGSLLQSSEQVQKYNAAKAAYEQDEEAQKLIKEFNLHRMTMMTLSSGEDADETRIAEVEERIKAVYGKIMECESMKNMQETGKAVEEMMGQVNGVLSFYITGEEPQSCTHDCSTCGGCH